MDRAEAFETERLVFVRQRPEHVAAISAAIDDFDIARMTTGVPHPYDGAAAASYAEALRDGDDARDLPFLIETRSGELVGGVGAHRRDGPFPEIGYWIARPAWGRGYATEAVRGLCRHVEAAWGCRALMAGHFVDNPASARVLDKAGFLYTGVVTPRLSLARGGEAATRMMVRLA